MSSVTASLKHFASQKPNKYRLLTILGVYPTPLRGRISFGDAPSTSGPTPTWLLDQGVNVCRTHHGKRTREVAVFHSSLKLLRRTGRRKRLIGRAAVSFGRRRIFLWSINSRPDHTPSAVRPL